MPQPGANAGFALVALFLLAAVSCAGADYSSGDFTVFGYLPEYRKNGFDYDAAFQTGLTHLIFFSLEVDPKSSLPSALDRLPSKKQAGEARRAADRVGGKLLIGFGGNARSAGFPRMVMDPARRAKFIESVQRLMSDYKFDGVDLNWEYPSSRAEWQTWRVLMVEMKQRLRAQGTSSPGDNVVTFTMYLDPNHYDIISTFGLLDDGVADFVHCMAYDQHGKHSTMDFAKSGIRLARQKKFNLGKFTLGVPFYGRDMRTGHPETYGDLHRRGLPNDETNVLGSQYFNSRKTIRRKTELSIKAGIGGVMIWELGQDVQPLSDRASLMSALQEGLAIAAPQRAGAEQEL